MGVKALALLLITIAASAEDLSWLGAYLQSKPFKCQLNENQLSDQVNSHIDRNVKQIEQALVARGSEINAIQPQHDWREIGIFENSNAFVFSVLIPVTVTIQKLNFQIQTTVYRQNETSEALEKGLWFPLTIADPGAGQPCQLERVALKQEWSKYFPMVDLVIGEPPRIVASRLIEVMNIENSPEPAAPATPAPPPTRAPEPTPTPTPTPGPTPQIQRRDNFRSERQQVKRRHRPQRRQRQEEPVKIEPPPKVDECAGDVSVWKSLTCKILPKEGE